MLLLHVQHFHEPNPSSSSVKSCQCTVIAKRVFDIQFRPGPKLIFSGVKSYIAICLACNIKSSLQCTIMYFHMPGPNLISSSVKSCTSYAWAEPDFLQSKIMYLKIPCITDACHAPNFPNATTMCFNIPCYKESHVLTTSLQIVPKIPDIQMISRQLEYILNLAQTIRLFLRCSCFLEIMVSNNYTLSTRVKALVS